ncbi:uncharacterized protein LOC121055809 [Oryza brachyantha]|uniref:uncharacterized protein LOC107305308 n=1 Tax=Oryza brachyantha TaxID=4533 RepID=UPI0007764205|nr:uncharacterized protein LOC107305308 [Oryza brachyantha]XP_040385037.1 uncharacterized protein LOC121055809 [Oryza brachyantha]
MGGEASKPERSASDRRRDCAPDTRLSMPTAAPPADAAASPSTAVADGVANTRRAVGNQAWLHRTSRKKKNHLTSKPAAAEPQHTREQLTINGEAVPFEVEDQYIDYCRSSATDPSKVTCHICFFEDHIFNITNKIQRKEMILHCHKHKGRPLIACQECPIYVCKARDLELHTHYCHTLPADWWRSR